LPGSKVSGSPGPARAQEFDGENLLYVLDNLPHLERAFIPIETWSSFRPMVGTLSTLAGCASTLHHSKARPRATCAIM